MTRRHPPSVLLLTGPTGVGKSEAAVRVAEQLGGEIVSADSRQVYHGLEIGTDAPAPDLRERVRHHLVGILDPRERWSAGRFAQQAAGIIADILVRGRQPLVVGGSGLYLRALTEGLFTEPPVDPAARSRVRARLQDRLRTEGLEGLFAELRDRDPAWSEAIGPADPQRTLRGLEVLELHGRTLSGLQHEGGGPPLEARWCLVVLERDRRELYRRIDVRVDAMVSAGWLEEARRLRDGGVPPDAPGLTGLGYARLYEHLAGRCDLDEALRRVRQEHRNYAKRQLTWFRGLTEAERIGLGPGDGPEETAAAILAVWDAFRLSAPARRGTGSTSAAI